jgi:hypothetical protein
MSPSTSLLRVAIVCAIALGDRGNLVEAAELVEASSLALPAMVSFNDHIRPILAKHCVACHGGVKQASGLSLIYREQALAACESGLEPIVPGAVDESYLIDRVSDADPETRMPPGEHGPALSEHQVALLKKWIEQGAEWEQHWSFVAPRPQEVPEVQREHWPRDAIDRFVLARMEDAGLAPTVEADRSTWLRRASLDLIGLPPSAEEYAAFEFDNRPDAYERVVDRLLASPQFGERWASMWLDLARYADTVGYEKDPHRDIWPYRDWLIRALNDDMPFDEFTVKQLAGDLLTDATIGDRLATAFHRNTQTNTEGGTDDEEFRTLAVLDRVGTTWQVWQGSTFRCTQCHSHPYDPFRHEEFYKFTAFFNTSRDGDINGDEPVLRVPDDVDAWDEAQRLDARMDEIRRDLFERYAELREDESLWRGLRADTATASGETKLIVRDDPVDGAAEVVAEGTTAAGSTFTMEFPLEGVSRLTSLRIDALPKDLAAALKTPESGFVLSRLKAQLIAAEGAKPAELKFAAVACDDVAPLFDPEESLRDKAEGWEAYTKISQPRRAVFLLKQPVEVAGGARLRVSLKFGLTDSGGGALFIQRARFAATESDMATKLVADDRIRELKDELAALTKERSQMPGTATPVMGELPPRLARRTYMFTRGNWLDKEKEVAPGVPEVMPPLPDGVEADRLAMARWLVAPENPLTSRVMVNRLWQELFGIGLVETADDFGTSGALPSHPELLDYLALRFQNEHGWSVKKLLRDLVLSATYRQAGMTSTGKVAVDPMNRLLSRGPRVRLSAEMVRDQALALSGRLSPKMYGRPVMPPQPAGVWRSVYNNQDWKTAEGEDRYRRAVYTYWKRTSGYPSFITFDAPSRDICVARRMTTNTPLQALVMLNDEAFVELAQGFAEQMQATGDERRAQIGGGYRFATGRAIPSKTLEALVGLYDEAAAAFDADEEKCKVLAETREVYALTIVANAMLNLDELLTK